MNQPADQTIISYGDEESDFYFDHVRRSLPFERNQHYHGTYEIYYLMAGERNYFVKEKLYPIKAGDLVLINKLDVHKASVIAEHGHERIVINFSDDFIDHTVPDRSVLLDVFAKGKPVIRLLPGDQAAVEYILAKMAQEITGEDYAYHSYLRLLLAELLIQIQRLAGKNEVLPSAPLNPLHQKITDIVRYIHLHYDTKISLDSLSRTFYISPYYLSRTFKEITGFTIVSYINLTRIREAQRLLGETDLKIIDIAQMTGFESLTHFDRTFKQHMKLTASRYRKMFKQHT